MNNPEIPNRSNDFSRSGVYRDTEQQANQEITRISPLSERYRVAVPLGPAHITQDETLRASLPSGWGYTGRTALNRLGLILEAPITVEVSITHACPLPDLVTAKVRQYRYGRNLLSPVEITVLECLESLIGNCELSEPALMEACHHALIPSKASHLISCTVNEPKIVRQRLIALLSPSAR